MITTCGVKYMVSSLYEILKKLRRTLESPQPTNYAAKIESACALKLLAERLNEVADIVDGCYEADVMRALGCAAGDRVPKVQIAAQEAKRAWETLHEKCRSLEKKAPDKALSPARAIQQRLGVRSPSADPANAGAGGKKLSKLGVLRQIMKMKKARPSTSVTPGGRSEAGKVEDLMAKWQAAVRGCKFLKRGMGPSGGFAPLPSIGATKQRAGIKSERRESIKKLIMQYALGRAGGKLLNVVLDKFGRLKSADSPGKEGQKLPDIAAPKPDLPLADSIGPVAAAASQKPSPEVEEQKAEPKQVSSPATKKQTGILAAAARTVMKHREMPVAQEEGKSAAVPEVQHIPKAVAIAEDQAPAKKVMSPSAKHDDARRPGEQDKIPKAESKTEATAPAREIAEISQNTAEEKDARPAGTQESVTEKAVPSVNVEPVREQCFPQEEQEVQEKSRPAEREPTQVPMAPAPAPERAKVAEPLPEKSKGVEIVTNRDEQSQMSAPQVQSSPRVHQLPPAQPHPQEANRSNESAGAVGSRVQSPVAKEAVPPTIPANTATAVEVPVKVPPNPSPKNDIAAQRYSTALDPGEEPAETSPHQGTEVAVPEPVPAQEAPLREESNTAEKCPAVLRPEKQAELGNESLDMSANKNSPDVAGTSPKEATAKLQYAAAQQIFCEETELAKESVETFAGKKEDKAADVSEEPRALERKLAAETEEKPIAHPAKEIGLEKAFAEPREAPERREEEAPICEEAYPQDVGSPAEESKVVNQAATPTNVRAAAEALQENANIYSPLSVPRDSVLPSTKRDPENLSEVVPVHDTSSRLGSTLSKPPISSPSRTERLTGGGSTKGAGSVTEAAAISSTRRDDTARSPQFVPQCKPMSGNTDRRDSVEVRNDKAAREDPTERAVAPTQRIPEETKMGDRTFPAALQRPAQAKRRDAVPNSGTTTIRVDEKATPKQTEPEDIDQESLEKPKTLAQPKHRTQATPFFPPQPAQPLETSETLANTVVLPPVKTQREPAHSEAGGNDSTEKYVKAVQDLGRGDPESAFREVLGDGTLVL